MKNSLRLFAAGLCCSVVMNSYALFADDNYIVKQDGIVYEVGYFNYNNSWLCQTGYFESGLTDANVVESVECKGMTHTVTGIGASSFANCETLRTATMSSGITYIDQWAFEECGALHTVTLNDGLEEIKRGAFYDCSSLEQINIPSTVTTIDYEAFAGCSSLKQIAIEGNINKVDASCFRDCSSLESVEIPASVKSVGSYAFKGCSSLKKVTCDAQTPPDCTEYGSYQDAFAGVDTANATLYVPAGTRAAYAAAEGWKLFGTIDDGTPGAGVTDMYSESGEAEYYTIDGVRLERIDSSATGVVIEIRNGEARKIMVR